MNPRRDNPGAGRIRIVGGRWRGTRLPVVDSAELRPTPDRVRETVFNWLQPRLAHARVLDLFAGTGALGLEAVSRGAREALLVEHDPHAAESLRDTIARLDAESEATVLRADAMTWLKSPLHGRFDLVFLDPPFAAGLWDRALALLPPWLADDAWLYLESPAASEISPNRGWLPHRSGTTRETRFAVYRREGARAATLGRQSTDEGAQRATE